MNNLRPTGVSVAGPVLRRLLALGVVAGIGLHVGSLLFAEEAREEKTGKVEQIVSLPYIQVDRKARQVRIEAELSPALRGMYAVLEFLLISGSKHEKTDEWEWERDYESVFVTKARPDNIQAALMLMGMMPGPLKQQAPERFVKDSSDRIKGDPVQTDVAKKTALAPLIDVLVEWQEEGKARQLRAEKFMYDRARKAPAQDTPWAFTGSYFVTDAKGQKRLAAGQSHVVMAVFHDPSAVVNLPFYTENAYWGDEVGLEVNAAHLPPFFRKDKVIVEGYTKRTIQVPVQHPVTLILQVSSMAQPTQSLVGAAVKEGGKDAPPLKGAEDKAGEKD